MNIRSMMTAGFSVVFIRDDLWLINQLSVQHTPPNNDQHAQ